MDLHRALEADWRGLKPGDMNRWQRLAAASHGLATPGNAISLLGLVLVTVGILLAVREEAGLGAGLIVLGRLGDLADGYIADKTGTKSPLGEAVDATIDKIVTAFVMLILLSIDGPARWFGVAVLLHFFYHISLFIIASRRRFRIHPSRHGKTTTFVLWIAAALYIIQTADLPSGLADTIGILAALSTLTFVGLGSIVAVQYTQQIKRG